MLDIAASKTGALSVLRDFYRCVAEREEGEDQWIFVTGTRDALKELPRKDIRIVTREDVKASSGARLFFEFFSGGRWINRFSPDVVFSLENTLPRGIGKRTRTVLYVHQPLGFQKIRKFSFWKKEERHLAAYQYLYAPLVDASVRRADRTIVQTEWMQKAVTEKTGTGKEKVIRIEPDVERLPEREADDRFDSRTFFYPAGDILYKNHSLITEALRILAVKGITGLNVILTKDEPLTREQVYRMYYKSTLLFPSYIETYGLPLAEAKQTGNPILAADTAFAREILKDCSNAYFFDPFRAGELAELMEKVISGEIRPGPPYLQNGRENSYSEIIKLIEGIGGADKSGDAAGV